MHPVIFHPVNEKQRKYLDALPCHLQFLLEMRPNGRPDLRLDDLLAVAAVLLALAQPDAVGKTHELHSGPAVDFGDAPAVLINAVLARLHPQIVVLFEQAGFLRDAFVVLF